MDGSILVVVAKNDACTVWEEEYLTADDSLGISHGKNDICWVDFAQEGASLASVDVSGKVRNNCFGDCPNAHIA